jgi:hypothetical protein
MIIFIVFMIAFGLIFLVTSISILLFKRENNSFQRIEVKTTEIRIKEAHSKISLGSTYIMIWKIIKLVPVKKLAFILMTANLAFITSHVTFLKLVENGVTKELQTLLTIPLTLISIIWTFAISSYINETKSLIFHFNVIPLKYICFLNEFLRFYRIKRIYI